MLYLIAIKLFLHYLDHTSDPKLHKTLIFFFVYYFYLIQAVNDLMTDFEKVNITLKASVTFRGTGDDLQAKMKELKVSYEFNQL